MDREDYVVLLNIHSKDKLSKRAFHTKEFNEIRERYISENCDFSVKEFVTIRNTQAATERKAYIYRIDVEPNGDIIYRMNKVFNGKVAQVPDCLLIHDIMLKSDNP